MGHSRYSGWVMWGILLILWSSVGVAQSLHSFTFRIRDEPETLDWNRAHTVVEAYILMNLMEGLVTFGPGPRAAPALAKEWIISPDGKTYTFKLRPGVKWSDGVPLRAQDFLYSWKRLLSPLTAAAYAYLLFDVVGAQDFNQGKLLEFEKVGIQAIDDLTLQVKLIHPVAHWLSIPAFWVTFPLRQDVVQNHGTQWDAPGRMVNLGPFSLVSHDQGSKVVMKSNPNYYGSHGNLDQITALIVPDDTTALKLFEAGGLDFLSDLGAMDVKRLRGRPELRVFTQLKTAFLGFLTETFPTSNLKFRRAIAMAIDKKKLSALMQGEQQPATSFVPPLMMGYSKTMGLPYHPARARAELRTSGVVVDEKLRLEYLMPNWDKSVQVADFIKKELKKNLGIEVVLKPMENKTYRTQLDLHTFPVFELTWTADYPDPDNFLSVYLGDSGNSRTTWKDQQFDLGVIAARQMLRPSDREAAYIRLQRFLLEEKVVLLPLYYEPNLALVRSRVKNLELDPMDYLYLRNVNVVP